MKMDRIVVLQGGSIVAQGTHQELLEQGGLYQKLWSIQAGGFLVDDKKTADGELADETDDENEDDIIPRGEGLAQPPPQK